MSSIVIVVLALGVVAIILVVGAVGRPVIDRAVATGALGAISDEGALNRAEQWIPEGGRNAGTSIDPTSGLPRATWLDPRDVRFVATLRVSRVGLSGAFDEFVDIVATAPGATSGAARTTIAAGFGESGRIARAADRLTAEVAPPS
jgi:hypothetical protein